MTLTLHHLNASRSQRIVWLLEELGADYEIIRHQRDAETMLAPPALLEVHRLGKAPVLEDGGAVIAESGAIAQHLVATRDPEHRLHPRAGDPDHARYLEWLHAAEGAAFLPGLFVFMLGRSGLGDQPLTERMRRETARAAAHVEAHLAAHPYFAGAAFSAADCMMGFQIENAERRAGLDGLPATSGWLARVRARPAHARMLATGV